MPQVGDVGGETLRELGEQLQQAVEREDYREAARIRDLVEERNMHGQLAVLAANEAFFAAVQARDLERMGELWTEGDHACCIHQAQRPVLGYAAVMESWRNLFRDRRRKKIEYALESVVTREDIGRAVVTSEKANQVITNFWEKGADGWKLWSHQAGTIKPVKPSTTLGTMALKVPNACLSVVKAVAKRLALGRRKVRPPKQKQLQHELQSTPR